MNLQKEILAYEKEEAGTRSQFLRILDHINFIKSKQDIRYLKSLKIKDKKIHQYVTQAIVEVEVLEKSAKANKEKKDKFRTLIKKLEALLLKKEMTKQETKEVLLFNNELSQLRYRITADQDFYNLDAMYVRFAKEIKKRGLK